MLAILRIQNFVLIDRVELMLGPGLNVLTGETGAGKSILVDALGLLLGGRARPDVVRTGAAEAEVEALFQVSPEDPAAPLLTAQGFLTGEELAVRRVVAQEGRSRAYINGHLATVAELARLGPLLMDIASQHESVSLTDPSTHLGYLDAFARLERDRARVASQVEQLREQRQLIKQGRDKLRTRTDQEAFLRYQMRAIEEIGPKSGEEDALAAERSRLRHASKLLATTQRGSELLEQGERPILDTLARLGADIRHAATLDIELVSTAEQLENARTDLIDVARTLGHYTERIEANPDRLTEVEDRLFALDTLKRQYGPSLDDVVATGARLQQELLELDGSEGSIAQMEATFARALTDAGNLAQDLSEKRRRAASRLAAAITKELGALGMGAANVTVDVAPLTMAVREDQMELELAFEGARLGTDGMDRVEFLIAPNRGIEPRPLRRVASGGELSRALLALKRVLADVAPAGSYVFDEVDAGVGGAIAECIGRALADVARHRQVLCITHLAPIAAFGQSHFVVEKAASGDGTRSTMTEVRGAQRVEELARMMSGATISEAARQAAVAMISDAEGHRPSSPPAIVLSREKAHARSARLMPPRQLRLSTRRQNRRRVCRY